MISWEVVLVAAVLLVATLSVLLACCSGKAAVAAPVASEPAALEASLSASSLTVQAASSTQSQSDGAAVPQYDRVHSGTSDVSLAGGSVNSLPSSSGYNSAPTLPLPPVAKKSSSRRKKEKAAAAAAGDDRAHATLDPSQIDKSKFKFVCGVCRNHYMTADDLATHRERRGHPADAPDWEVAYGELLLSKVLGEGAFGIVRLAWFRGETVAVKMLKSFDGETQVLSPAETAAFETEAELMRKLPPHPNVIKLIGVVTKTMPNCIVTQFAANGSLEGYLKSHRGKLKPAQRLTMCVDAVRGIMHLHKHHLVHRDIAARNFLIDERGSILLTDFGLTRAVMSDKGTTKTRSGPLRYMAPESLHRQEYSTASDVWSTGVLMWEVESGAEVPYKHLSLAQTAMQVCMEGLRLEEPDGCVPGLHDLMMRMWVTEVSERATMPEVLQELMRLSDNQRSEYALLPSASN